MAKKRATRKPDDQLAPPAPAVEDPRPEDVKAARIRAALIARGADLRTADADALYAELFPEQISLHEFRTVCTTLRNEQQ